MKHFTYHAPTAVYYDTDCIRKQEERIAGFGRRAFIITCKFPDGCRNHALEDMTTLFAAHNIAYAVSDEAIDNPTVENVKYLTELVRAYQPDFLVGIGGGSALDAAKAVNVLLNYPACDDPYKVFYGGSGCGTGCSCGLLPIIAVPTAVGSGSDVMGYAILTRADTATKLAIGQRSFYDATFLDAKYVLTAPQWLVDAGAMDALCHGIEGWMCKDGQTHVRLWHEYGLELFSKVKNNLLACTLTAEDYGVMLVAATMQGIALMQSNTTIPHGMGYSLTHDKGITHGIATVMVLPAYLYSFENKTDVLRLVKRCGFDTLEDFEACIDTIVARNVEIQVTRGEIEEWSEQMFSLKDRLVRNPEPVTKEMIRNMYLHALRNYLID